jgi:general transcription factor 3C polypeptide 3 (transcription factor C subunit 4)
VLGCALVLDQLEGTATSMDMQGKEQPWWRQGKVLMKLAQLYLSQNRLTYFVDTILPAIQESLYVESLNQKVRLTFHSFAKNSGS